MTELESFREQLLSHARSPRHSGRLGEKAFHGECTNPLCGDKVHVSVQVEDARVTEIKSQTAGCSMAIASASMMTELALGKSLIELEELRQTLSEALLDSSGSAWPLVLSPLLPLSHLRENPTRVPCALMGWFALKDALKDQPKDQPKSI